MKANNAIICFTVIFSLNSQASQKPDINGEVIDIDSGQVLYTEEHRFSEVNGNEIMHSVFTDSDGRKMAERKVEYKGDRVQSYRLQQFNIDYAESIMRDTGGIRIGESTNSGDELATVETQDANTVVIDAGFSNFVLRHWDELKTGKTKKFRFASSDQKDIVKLRIKHRQSADGVDYFDMTLANPLIRLLLKPIQIGYYSDTKQLAFYKGISNLKDRTGKRFSNVQISYPRQSRSLASRTTIANGG